MYLIGVFYFFRAYNYKSYKSTCHYLSPYHGLPRVAVVRIKN